ncbi:MAG TPA: tetratricopeptide repeat protein [Chryseolinea sp.]|nr:tetratricopeptide repeat protein [Chryseolinea sp.]
MNRLIIAYHKRKAAILACLFLFVGAIPGLGSAGNHFEDMPEWYFDAPTQSAYELVLNLQLEEAHQIIPEPVTAQQHYVIALAEALELLITEDGEKYTEYESRFTERLERKTSLNVPDDLFLQAEIRMQWTFIYLKFGHEFDAALNLRQAYLTIDEIRNRFPKFQSIKKTSGLLEVIIGSVPQKYNWVLSLLNMEGSTKTGLAELDYIRSSGSALAFEANLVHALIQGFLLQQPGQGVNEINTLRTKHPKNRLALFLASALSIKDNQSENALKMLDSLSQNSVGIPLYYADYLRGEIFLHKGEYLNSISSYRSFINHYNGQNGVKDGYFKIGLCYWLNGNTNDAEEIFKQAKSRGKEASEADKYAARSLADDELPHIQLTKARYATDGGYYDRAKQILELLQPKDIPTKRDQVEYAYRMARLAHKINDTQNAKTFYQKSVTLSGDEDWYYAPNACLQLGYILLNEGDTTLAKSYFTKALSYGKHEYKNSIDSKAKSGLAQIKRK